MKLHKKLYPYWIPVVALILTSLTSVIVNPFLPMLFPTPLGGIYITMGADLYGYLLPFKVAEGAIAEFDWISFLINIFIFSIIIWKIESIIYELNKKKRKR